MKMKNANDLALEGYSISDLVKIVNDYEQLKSLMEEQEETIAELRKENKQLEEQMAKDKEEYEYQLEERHKEIDELDDRRYKAESLVEELKGRLSGGDYDDLN